MSDQILGSFITAASPHPSPSHTSCTRLTLGFGVCLTLNICHKKPLWLLLTTIPLEKRVFDAKTSGHFTALHDKAVGDILGVQSGVSWVKAALQIPIPLSLRVLQAPGSSLTFNSTQQLEPFWIYHLGGLSASWTLLDTAKLMEKGKIQNDGVAAETPLLREWKT